MTMIIEEICLECCEDFELNGDIFSNLCDEKDFDSRK